MFSITQGLLTSNKVTTYEQWMFSIKRLTFFKNKVRQAVAKNLFLLVGQCLLLRCGVRHTLKSGRFLAALNQMSGKALMLFIVLISFD